MIALNIILDGDNCWPDLRQGKKMHHLKGGFAVAGLWSGMTSGEPSVAFRMDLDDGSVVVAETSLALFLSAADVLKSKYGDPRR